MAILNITFEYSIKQSKAFKLLSQHDKSVEVCYGGAKYGGKSHFGTTFCYTEAIRLIKTYDIRRSVNPIPIGFMGRKVGRDFMDTTLETWKKVIPRDAYRIKGKPPEIIIANRLKYFCGGLDRQETVNKFNSAELCVYFIDQAEETQQDDLTLLRAAVFWRLIINGHTMPGKGLLTANPAQCWLKPVFIDPAA